MYVKIITPQILAEFAVGNPYLPRVYYDKSPVVRWLYWRRLDRLLELAKRFNPSGSGVLDFGTGSGILLPSLSAHYPEVRAIDRVTVEAQKVVNHFLLSNVTLIEADANQLPFADGSLDCVFAASVLEHFQDVDRPAREIARVLKKGGVFACSSPTENALYQVGRKVFGYTKPADHYQTARSIRQVLARHMKIEKIMHGPFPLGHDLAAYEIVLARKA